MRYNNIKEGIFLKRPNRFLAHVLIDDKEEIVHVKNTGRCKEILKEGVKVILEPSSNPNRKTAYSLIAAYKGGMLINIDSQIPNMVVFEGIKDKKIPLLSDTIDLKREVGYKNSRFDIYFERKNSKGFLEVKGVTLEKDGIAMFPDAPTERGRKHLLELGEAVSKGYEGFVVFFIQFNMGEGYFTPNSITDPKFAEALSHCASNGVKILSYDSKVEEDQITINKEIKIHLV